jgi:endonuclease/exonuclease/phosphatase family metal-dependent hydrolase
MPTLRVATYNIHKGVQGLGPVRRLEIHNIGHAIEQLDADVVCLQEVRKGHRKEEKHFKRWPAIPQADFLAPEGYEAIYKTNAVTPHGEHGNAVLSRWPVVAHQHEDMSDHRFEQRGLLHAEMTVHGQSVHVLVVHLGLVRASRQRQLQQLCRYIAREIAPDAPLLVAGDFNEWGPLLERELCKAGLSSWRQKGYATFPSRLPLLQLDHVYARGLRPLRLEVPRGGPWTKMSDHLPLIAEFELPPLALHLAPAQAARAASQAQVIEALPQSVPALVSVAASGMLQAV